MFKNTFVSVLQCQTRLSLQLELLINIQYSETTSRRQEKYTENGNALRDCFNF